MLRAVQSAREAARRATCQNNLKQIGLAVQMYHQTYEQFPMGSNYQRGALWSAYLLPFVKQKPMFDSLTWSEGGAGQWAAKSPGVRDTSISPVHRNILACETVIDTYRCPSVPGTYLASASGLLTDQNGITSNPVSKPHFRELDGVMFNDSRVRRRHVTDGMTSTLLVAEAVPVIDNSFSQREFLNGNRKDHWYVGSDDIDTSEGGDFSEAHGSTGVPMNLQYVDGVDIQQWQLSYGSVHPGGCQGVLCDGLVRFFQESIDLTVWSNLGRRDDGRHVQF